MHLSASCHLQNANHSSSSSSNLLPGTGHSCWWLTNFQIAALLHLSLDVVITVFSQVADSCQALDTAVLCLRSSAHAPPAVIQQVLGPLILPECMAASR